MTEEQVRLIIRQELSSLIRTDRFTFQKLVQILDGRNIQVGKTTGTKIGTEVTQKIGFFGKTPVNQLSKADYNNWAAYTDVVNALVDIGLIDAA